MALQTQAEIEAALFRSAERVKTVREAAEQLKSARLQVEQESAQRTVELIKPSLSPLTQRER